MGTEVKPHDDPLTIRAGLYPGKPLSSLFGDRNGGNQFHGSVKAVIV